ncbi:MgtC/SapB family protein [Candidatus Azambacteria bacterium]|nr:MgtC/SapB family protein [Candidatus Azambacteria bacterium]
MDFLGPFNFEIFFKLILAFILGLVVGIERESAGKEAGPRTYSLITVGTTLFTILSLDPRFFGDTSRIISQILPGIGFIGAGLIIFRESKVHGLATAAGVWVMASIGIAVGMGYYLVSVFSVLLALSVLYLFRKFDFDAKIRNLSNLKDSERSDSIE